ncbi:MAG: CHASE2 domain-containing protein [Burkholderiales bacterium]
MWTDWSVVTLTLVAITAFGYTQQWAWRVDLAIYDMALALWSRPAPSDVVIVAIDDASLERIGRWPWSRYTQARLLEQIAAGGPRAVALDVLLAEPAADRAADAALASALGRIDRVVLATAAVEGLGLRRFYAPLPALAGATQTFGHVHVEIDPDAVVRSVYLREGPASADTPHLALALLTIAGTPIEPLPGLARRSHLARPGYWQRDHWLRIPFAGPPGHFERIPAADVLEGRIEPGSLNEKLVLVGATAAGVGDGYAVPTSASSRLMPGVEISANVLEALRSRIDIRDLPPAAGVAAAVVPVLCTLLAYLWLGPRASLLFTVAVAAAVMLAAVLGPRTVQLWFPPAITLGVLALCYPLWSWRRLDASLAYMREELRAQEAERDVLPIPADRAPAASAFAPDAVERTIHAVRAATERVRSLRRFVADTLERQADGALVSDLDGRIVFSNARAAALVGAPIDPGMRLRDVLERIERADSGRLAFLTTDAVPMESVRQFEGHARDGRELLVSIANCRGAGDGIMGYIVNLTDVSELKVAGKAREEAMSFLSHDLRAPQASILSAIELRRSAPAALTETSLLAQIERSAQRALGLAEAFVTLTRADHVDRRDFVAVDLADVAREMAQEAWPLARAKSIRIAQSIEHDDAWIAGDRTLLGAAVLNLLTNAIKYAPGATGVTIGVRRRNASWTVSVRDQGPGISEHALPLLFERFRRLEGGADGDGAGLGLAIVEAVARKHGGGVEVESEPGRGSVFTIVLPALGRHPEASRPRN